LANLSPFPPVMQALAREYAHYRSIQGDGNCGWRGECVLAEALLFVIGPPGY